MYILHSVVALAATANDNDLSAFRSDYYKHVSGKHYCCCFKLITLPPYCKSQSLDCHCG